MAALHDVGAALQRGNQEELVAAVEAMRQVPIDLERTANVLRIPSDAREYEDALRALLEQIPDGWGRWIQCGPGWYPILARLNERLEEIALDYQVLQIKEKLGTLSFHLGIGENQVGKAAVAEAEAESARTCERCRSPGHLRIRNSWYRTVCDDCARSEGYGDLQEE